MKFTEYQEQLARELKARGDAPACVACACGSDMQRWSQFDSTAYSYLRIVCDACDRVGPSAQYAVRSGLLFYQNAWHGSNRALLIELWNRAIVGETVADQYHADAAAARRLDEERAAGLAAWHRSQGR